eukprot:1334985-Rhodomonas_salina.6
MEFSVLTPDMVLLLCSAICLRNCYGVCGTDLAYSVTAVGLQGCCAISGTDVAYAQAGSKQQSRCFDLPGTDPAICTMRCPVLTYCTDLPVYALTLPIILPDMGRGREERR